MNQSKKNKKSKTTIFLIIFNFSPTQKHKSKQNKLKNNLHEKELKP